MFVLDTSSMYIRKKSSIFHNLLEAVNKLNKQKQCNFPDLCKIKFLGFLAGDRVSNRKEIDTAFFR